MTDYQACPYYTMAGGGGLEFPGCIRGPLRHGCVTCCFGCGLREPRHLPRYNRVVAGCHKACEGPVEAA
jgi:hypothetical protein